MTAAPPLSGRPTWSEIDLDAILHNYEALETLLLPECGSRLSDRGLDPRPGPSIRNPRSAIRNRLIPVLKADAYGHGAVRVARTLADAGASCLAVAIVEEGVALREAGIETEILVLEGCWPGQEEQALAHRLTTAVHSVDGVERMGRAARRRAVTVSAHLKIDTGMNRLGVPWNRIDPVVEALEQAAAIRLAGVFSHLACAEEEDPEFTREQAARFQQALSRLRVRGIEPGELHLANSAGLLYHSTLRAMGARPGIALYGYAPDPGRSPVTLAPAMTLKSRIGRIEAIAAGDSVGYNRLFVASRPGRIATLPVGYADGYRRSLAGKGWVIVRDRMAPVLGSVNMDMIVIDVTDLPGATEGEEVILLGRSEHCRVDAAVLAQWLGTSPYEILCGISSRVPRLYAAV